MSLSEQTPSPQRVLDLYATMCRIRAFERMVIRGTEEDLVKGAAHLSIGQEAVAAGICGNLRRMIITWIKCSSRCICINSVPS